MVVVEVQRRAGCSFRFRELSRSVLKSSKGISTTAPKRKFTIPSCVPKMSMEQREKRMEDGLNIARNMLSSNRVDSHMLAMESLMQMTKGSSFTAKQVLKGEFFGKLFAFAKCEEILESDMERERAAVMKRRALAILANALESLSADELLAVVESSELCSRSFVAALTSTLNDAANQGHEAAQAARCIKQCLSSKVVVDLVTELSAMGAADVANSVGACHCITLERESKKLKLHLEAC